MTALACLRTGKEFLYHTVERQTLFHCVESLAGSREEETLRNMTYSTVFVSLEEAKPYGCYDVKDSYYLVDL